MFHTFIYLEFLVIDKVELEEHKTSGFIFLAISVRFAPILAYFDWTIKVRLYTSFSLSSSYILSWRAMASRYSC